MYFIKVGFPQLESEYLFVKLWVQCIYNGGVQVGEIWHLTCTQRFNIKTDVMILIQYRISYTTTCSEREQGRATLHTSAEKH